ncbi:MarR family winged helix-turn-helix transcriptional regulator [Polycladidibacter stylochi]|uniref:MarR family winged helix-turn-helix transcriptional regulator n=1 Tax=Polycladidibacter stylochi TaxID=1807766 RepID=UPI00083492BD|nr:MarR family winged helix-turn-helix transcriptional regulator [Pseudovibrio stylochi]
MNKTLFNLGDSTRDELSKRLLGEVTTLYFFLNRLSASLMNKNGLTPFMRSLLLHIENEGPQTVPQIAQQKRVSRQNIQVPIDQLRDKGLIDAIANEAHKRSKKYQLTDKGKDLTAKVIEQEVALMAPVINELGSGKLLQAIHTLQHTRQILEQLTTEADKG